MRVCNDTCPVAPSYNILSSSDFFEPDRDGQILTRRPELAKVLQCVGGCREAPYDTRESGSDGARALQMGSIGHVGGCREAPYDKR